MKPGNILWTGKHTKIVMPKEEDKAPSSSELLLEAIIFAGTCTWGAMKAVITIAAFLLSWFFLYAVFSVAFGSYSSSGSEIETAGPEKIAEFDITATQATEQRYEEPPEVLLANLENNLLAVNEEIAKNEQRSRNQIQNLQIIQEEILAGIARMKQKEEEKKMNESGDRIGIVSP